MRCRQSPIKPEACSELPLKKKITHQNTIHVRYIIRLQKDKLDRQLDRHWTNKNIHIREDRQTNRYGGKQQDDA